MFVADLDYFKVVVSIFILFCAYELSLGQSNMLFKKICFSISVGLYWCFDYPRQCLRAHITWSQNSSSITLMSGLYYFDSIFSSMFGHRAVSYTLILLFYYIPLYGVLCIKTTAEALKAEICVSVSENVILLL
jgi:hypothetical protein